MCVGILLGSVSWLIFLHDRKELVTLMYEDAFLSYKTKDRTAEETQYVMNGM